MLECLWQVILSRLSTFSKTCKLVNHHLFFADLALKDVGLGQLMPQAEFVVFDEAHLLADIAADYFGESVSSNQLLELCRDITIEYHRELTDMRQLLKAVQKLERTVADWRLLFPIEPTRGNWRQQLKQLSQQQLMQRLKKQ